MRLDVERLRAFTAVARHGSVTGAARTLSLTPSAVSQQLGKLEAQLGSRLLDRSGPMMTTTPTGTVVLAHAERVLGELADAEDAITAAAGAAQARPVGVGTFTTAGVALLPSALARFHREHPDVAVHITDLEPPAGYGRVSSGELDVLITHRYTGVPDTPSPGLERRPLLTDPLLLAADAPGPSDLADLADRHWVSGAPGVANRVCLEHLAHRAGFTPLVAHETADYQLTAALVAAGLGVALIPRSSVPSGSRLVLRPLPGAAREITVLHRPRPREAVTTLLAALSRATK